jgi:hypothetical protein
MNITEGYYVSIKNDGTIINIDTNLNNSLNYINNYINNCLSMLKMYSADIKKFNENLGMWKIVYFNNGIEQGYYYIENNKLLSTNLKNIDFKLNISNNNNNKISTEINKIFISNEDVKDQTNIIECNLPVKVNDVSLLKHQSTESLINSCLNNEIEVTDEKKKRIIELQNKIKILENAKSEEQIKLNKEELKKKAKLRRVELKRKLMEEKEASYRKKFLIDKKLYYVFKKEIADGKRNEKNIPVLFLKQWHIFKELESQDMLSTDILNIIDSEINKYKVLDRECNDKDFGDSYSSLFKSIDMNELLYSRDDITSSTDETSEESETESESEDSDSSSEYEVKEN